MCVRVWYLFYDILFTFCGIMSTGVSFTLFTVLFTMNVEGLGEEEWCADAHRARARARTETSTDTRTLASRYIRGSTVYWSS